MGWFEFRNSSKSKTLESPNLEDLVKPYREAIVGTSTPPASARIEVRSWEDLTRASDTLGKPILRYAPDGGPGGRTFYVLDGPTTYVFEYGSPPSNGGAPPSDPIRGPELSSPTPVEPAKTLPSPVPTTFSAVELASSGARPVATVPEELPALRDRARGLLGRVTAMPSSDPALNRALAALGQAIVSMRAGRLAEAKARLDAVERMIAPR